MICLLLKNNWARGEWRRFWQLTVEWRTQWETMFVECDGSSCGQTRQVPHPEFVSGYLQHCAMWLIALKELVGSNSVSAATVAA